MRLNKIFFGVGIYGIIILVLGVIGWFISLPKVDEPFPLRDETKVLQEQKLRLRVKNKNEQVFEQYEITLPIQQGIARIEDNKLISINNLLLYKGFVVPQKTQIFLSGTASTLPSIRHFMAS